MDVRLTMPLLAALAMIMAAVAMTMAMVMLAASAWTADGQRAGGSPGAAHCVTLASGSGPAAQAGHRHFCGG
jgi:hypothetical protein